MIIDSPIISGSYAATGSLNQVGNVVITGSLTVTGPINGALTGSVDSASFASTAVSSSYAASATSASYAVSATSSSYAINASFLNNSGSGEFVPTGSFNAFSSSILSYTSSNDTNIGNLNATSASLNTFTGSAASRLSSIESTTASLNTASGSAIIRLNALESASGSAISRLNNIESTTGSLNAASGSAITRLSALEVTSGSNITRISALELASGSAISRLSSLESRTGSYATTGSNTFVGGQYISASFNPTGFTTTASLYTDGGLRVGRDAYISGTLYLNNVTVYGTQSVCFITSSQLNISSNIISVNTATPSVRFGGLAVYDSGSTGLTGSILWDSQDNQWIYSNPSGSAYDSAMFLVGPRNSGVLGNEVGIECNFLSKGNGMHHMTSSGIFDDGSRTCFYGTTVINSSGTVCSTMGNFTCMGVGSPAPAYPLDICGTARSTTNFVVNNGTVVGNFAIETAQVQIGTSLNHPFVIYTCNNERIRVTNTGIACFSCQVCAPAFVGGTISGTTGTFSSNVVATGSLIVAPSSNLELQVQSTGVTIGNLASDTHNVTGSLNVTGSFRTVGTVCATGNTCFGGMSVVASCLGIGTSTPLRTLHVRGGNGTAQIESTGNNSILYFGDVCSTGIDNRGIGSIGNDLWFMAGGLERVRFTSAGIACFSNQICAQGATFTTTGNTAVTIAAGATGLSRLVFQGTVGNYRGFIDYDNSICGFIIRTNENEAMRITCIGNVAIGSQNTVTIPNRLTITEDNSPTFLGIYRNNVAISQEMGGVQWTNGGAGTQIAKISVFTSSDFSDTGNITFSTRASGGSQTERLRITSAGVSCFAGTTCIPTLMLGASVAANFRLNVSGHYSAETASWPTDGSGDCYRSGIGWQSTANAAQVLSSFITTINDGNYGGHIVFLNRGTNGGNLNERFRITSGGIACFSSTVCTAVLNAAGELYLGGSASNFSIISRTTSPVGSQGIILTSGVRRTESASGLTFADNSCSGATIQLSGNSSDIYGGSVEIIAYGQDNTTGNQINFYSRRCNATLANRLAISGQGVATFACYICTPSIYLTCTVDAKICAGAGIGLNIDGAALYLNRYSNSSIVAGGSIVPLCNGNQDLGSANCRWCTVYTSDLSLNNGIGNYTIVEGKNDLFLYNNNSCKVYKFVVQEVCPEIAPAKRSI